MDLDEASKKMLAMVLSLAKKELLDKVINCDGVVTSKKRVA